MSCPFIFILPKLWQIAQTIATIFLINRYLKWNILRPERLSVSLNNVNFLEKRYFKAKRVCEVGVSDILKLSNKCCQSKIVKYDTWTRHENVYLIKKLCKNEEAFHMIYNRSIEWFRPLVFWATVPIPNNVLNVPHQKNIKLPSNISFHVTKFKFFIWFMVSTSYFWRNNHPALTSKISFLSEKNLVQLLWNLSMLIFFCP